MKVVSSRVVSGRVVSESANPAVISASPTTTHQSPITTHESSGVVLLVVLLVVGMLALGGYSFATLMNAEAQGAKVYGRLLQARAAADSGVHYVTAILVDQQAGGALGVDLYDAPAMFHGHVVTDTTTLTAQTDPQCLFSVVAPREKAETLDPLRYGLAEEAARINLNEVWNWSQNQGGQASSASVSGDSSVGYNPFLYLPNMTPEIADAILDWMDPDDDPRPYGAEWDYYQALDPSYQPKNGPLDSLDELLLVRDVTPRLLYGEDANRNGILDPNEDDADLSYPSDDGNGVLDRGWLPYLTLYSHESNTDSLGLPRINLNSDDLEALYDQLSGDPDFGEEPATFIVAYRLFDDTEDESEGEQGQRRQEEDQDRSDRQEEREREEDDRDEDDQSGGSSQTIAGLDASGGAKRKIDSVTDLIDARVRAKIENQEERVMLESPFRSDELGDFLDTLLDRTTTVEETDLPGRINANSAAEPVLMAVPGMTEELTQAIVAAQPQPEELAEGSLPQLAWLLTSGVLTVQDFKRFEPYITGRSQVYRVRAVGYFESGGPVSRIEAVIDVTGTWPQIKLWRDLTPLGRGYDPQVLLSTVGM